MVKTELNIDNVSLADMVSTLKKKVQEVEHRLEVAENLLFETKERVNRDKLRGKEKLKYQFYDKAMRCRKQSTNWQEFDETLRNKGLKLRFHFNNVTGKLMGVVFTDGKHTFSGKQLDNALKLSSLVEQFGDPKEITHDNVCSWYEQYKLQLRYRNDWQGYMALDRQYPDIYNVFPDGEIPDFKYPSVENLLSHRSPEVQETLRDEYVHSEDGKSVFVPVGVMFVLLLQPYAPQLSMGGGGGGSAQSAPSEENTRSLLKRLLNRLYEDMISCWWKTGAYILCFCSLTCSCYLGYKNYRMTNIVKEYGILNPTLMHHRDFRDFMKSLDEVLSEDDIDDVLKRLEEREKKDK